MDPEVARARRGLTDEPPTPLDKPTNEASAPSQRANVAVCGLGSKVGERRHKWKSISGGSSRIVGVLVQTLPPQREQSEDHHAEVKDGY